MASKRNSLSLTKRKSRTLVDSDVQNLADAQNVDAQSIDASNDPSTPATVDVNQGVNQQPDANANPNPNRNSLSFDLRRQLARKAKDKAAASNDLYEEKRLINELSAIDNAEQLQNAATIAPVATVARDPNAAYDDDGNKYTPAEFAYLKELMDSYQEAINKEEPNGVLETDKVYFPDVQWNKEKENASKAFKDMDVDTLSADYVQSVDSNEFLMVSEPHGPNAGFALTMQMLEDATQPGVLMLEAPTALNLSDDKLSTYGHWGLYGGQNTKFGLLVQKALQKGWDIVGVDATKPDGNMSTRIFHDSDMPGNYDDSDQQVNPFGSLSRQHYIAKNVHSTMERYKGQRGGILLIGTKHITGTRNVPDLSPMVSKLMTSEVSKQVSMVAMKGKKVNKKSEPFKIVEVDHTEILDEVDYNPQ